MSDDRTIAAATGGAGTAEALKLRLQRQRSALVGVQLGDTRIEKFLGQGGMATVYLGKQVQLEREVAVKVLSPKLTKDRNQVDQFFREAKTLAKLEHPNITTIYSVGQKDTTHFLIMQLIRGGSLRKLLLERQVFPPDEATDVVRQIAEGLKEAHNSGIVHRDIKPDNILVGKGSTYKITDFGLAMMGGDSAFTEGKVVGTPHYISPEQVDAKNVDKRTDIYALGATYYHLLTGKPPFKGKSTIDLLMKHVSEPPVPPHEVNPAVPAGVSNIVLRMMAKSPDDRYQDAESLLADLARPERAQEAEVTVVEEEHQPTLLLSGKLEPMGTLVEPVSAPAPKGARYGFILVLLAAAGLIGAGYGPLQTVLEDLKAQAQNPLGAMQQITMEGFDLSVKGLAPEEALIRFADLLESNPELEAPIRERMQALQRQIKASRKSAGKKLIAQAKELQSKKALGPALDLLATAKEGDEDAKALRAALEEELEALGMVWIPAAKDLALGDGPHRRTVATLAGYYLGVDEVTRGEWAEFVSKHGGKAPADWKGNAPPAGTEQLPVTGITFTEARAYAESRGLRLPTPDEWEHAARGPQATRWPWGDEANAGGCNWRRDQGSRLAPAGKFPKDLSSTGCLDMAGNAAELVDASGAARVYGGSYLTRRLENARAAFFVEVPDSLRHSAVGFRCAASELPGGGE